MTDAPQLYLMTPAGAQASSLAPMLAEVMDRVAQLVLLGAAWPTWHARSPMPATWPW